MKYMIDFDGVLAFHDHDWPPYATGQALAPACNYVRKLLAEGHEVAVLTARIPEYHHVVRAWLQRADLPLRVTNVKEPSDFYIDDKAIAWPRNLE